MKNKQIQRSLEQSNEKSDLLKLVEKTGEQYIYTLLNYMLSIYLLKSSTKPYIK